MRSRTKRNLALGGLLAFAGYALFARPKTAVGSPARSPGGNPAVPFGAPPVDAKGAPIAIPPATVAASNKEQLFPANTEIGRTVAGAGPLGTPVPLGTNIPVSASVNLHFDDVLRVRTPNTSAVDRAGNSRLTRYTIVKLKVINEKGLQGVAVAYEFPDGVFVPAPTNIPFVAFQRGTVEGFAYGYSNGAPPLVGGGGVGV